MSCIFTWAYISSGRLDVLHGIQALVMLHSMIIFLFFYRSLTSLCSRVDSNFLLFFLHRFSIDFLIALAPLDYATFIGFKFLPSYGTQGDVLRDMPWFMGLPTVRTIYDESFLYIRLWRANIYRIS